MVISEWRSLSWLLRLTQLHGWQMSLPDVCLFVCVCMCAFRAEASLQSGLRERPSRAGGHGRRHRSRKKRHPPEPSASRRCSRWHSGHLRSQHPQLHRLTRVPQCTALSEHGAGQDEAGDQQVTFIVIRHNNIETAHLSTGFRGFLFFFDYSPLSADSMKMNLSPSDCLIPGCWNSCWRRRESIRPSCNRCLRRESRRSDYWGCDLSPQVCIFICVTFPTLIACNSNTTSAATTTSPLSNLSTQLQLTGRIYSWSVINKSESSE